MLRILPRSVCLQGRGYFSSVRTFLEVPSLTLLDMIKFTNPYNDKHLKSTFQSFFLKHGNIFRTRLPGTRYDIVYISDPEDAQILLNSDGQFPIIPGFDFFVSYRNKVSQSVSLFILYHSFRSEEICTAAVKVWWDLTDPAGIKSGVWSSR